MYRRDPFRIPTGPASIEVLRQSDGPGPIITWFGRHRASYSRGPGLPRFQGREIDSPAVVTVKRTGRRPFTTMAPPKRVRPVRAGTEDDRSESSTDFGDR